MTEVGGKLFATRIYAVMQEGSVEGVARAAMRTAREGGGAFDPFRKKSFEPCVDLHVASRPQDEVHAFRPSSSPFSSSDKSAG